MGPVVTLYQTFGNATTGKTEVQSVKPNHVSVRFSNQPAVYTTNCQVLANGEAVTFDVTNMLSTCIYNYSTVNETPITGNICEASRLRFIKQCDFYG
jgi:hypothetical protein